MVPGLCIAGLPDSSLEKLVAHLSLSSLDSGGICCARSEVLHLRAILRRMRIC